MNKEQFAQLLAAHTRATVVLSARDRLVALPGDNALAIRRAERMEKDGLGTWLGVYAGPDAWEFLQEDVAYVKSTQQEADAKAA